MIIENVSELHFNNMGVAKAVVGSGEDKKEIAVDFMDTFLQENTGKFDNEGYMIFSGDLVEIAEKVYSVIFLDGAFRIFLVADNGETTDILDEATAMNCKIIGNIYKNKDLAEPKVDFNKFVEDKLNEKKE